MFFFNFDYMMFMIPAFLIMMGTQVYVNSTYRKWSKVASLSRMNGAQAAQSLIRREGLTNVQIEAVRGNLTDHYDPRSKVLRLSEGVYQSGICRIPGDRGPRTGSRLARRSGLFSPAAARFHGSSGQYWFLYGLDLHHLGLAA